jgi:uncharacterized membrane protein
LAGAAAAALLVYQFFGLRQRLSALQSALLVLLRLCVYAVLIFFLFGPAFVDERVTHVRRPLTVLIDNSESMGFPAAARPTTSAGKSRLDAVREKLTGGGEALIQKLNREYDLKVFRFGTGIEPIAPDSVAQLEPHDQGSRLIELLQNAAKDAGAQSGILLFSDGITNGAKRTLEASAPLAAPVFAVAVGETEAFVDARISDVRAPEFAFRGRELKIDVTVKAAGLKGNSFPLYFNRGKNLITSRAINVDADPFERTITLAFTPKELGTHGFSVSVPPQPGEQISRNNQKEFKVDVQRDKIRVLTLSGSPAWNYRFLRMAMKQDPLIELVSFVFLRTPTDSVDVPDNQLSLIPFPIDDIFLEELKNFDVVFFDDFSHRAYFNPVYLEKVRDFVQEGGGLAVWGGSRAFDNGGYNDSALREVVPVELDGKGSYRSHGEVRPMLTAAGKAHPITRLLPDARGNEETWKKMPPLTGLNQVRGARGETLLSAAGDGAGAPLLTVGRFGKGRTLAFMSDDAWRWNFIAVGQRESPQNHLKLVRQATRWLAQEPSFEQVRIRPVASARPGEALRIKLRVLKDDFTPTRQATVQLRVTGPDGDTALVATGPEAEEGDYSGEYTPTREGAYRVEAEATLSGRTLGRDRTSFSAALAYGEIDDGLPRPDLLKQIAEHSGGDFFPIASFNEKALETIAAKLEEHAPSQIIERTQTRLWSTLWPFSIVLTLLSIEWWMRRKWGLI